MDNADNRDYAEEAANLRTMREEYADDIREEHEQKLVNRWLSHVQAEARVFVEKVRKLHYSVATSEYRTISAGDGKVYLTTQTMLKAAIRAAYPDQDTVVIYDIWEECNESIRHCADVAYQHQLLNCYWCSEEYMREELHKVSIIGIERLFCAECRERLEAV